ncbi:hypothetical protein J6TS2_26380 [Heyndrickxia sporothermodurans]|nr:hypothetical protein J6TS2_26380 [Heyndrickxia sporothermodurans]
MKLGLKNNEVKIVPYTSDWHEEFLKVKKEISKSTHIEENQIEHIGSTAIKDMQAKPIIDVMVAVDDLDAKDPSIIKGLKAIGFLRLKVERPNEIVLAKLSITRMKKKHTIFILLNMKKNYGII